MSRVPSSKRKPSEVEFITNAEKIHELVIKSIYHDFGVKTDSQNKMWLIASNKNVLKTYADRLISCIYAANSIYPSCREEVIERKLQWDKALGYCQTIETQYKLMKRELDIHLGLEGVLSYDTCYNQYKSWRQSIIKSYNACYTTINALDTEFKEIFGREFEL